MFFCDISKFLPEYMHYFPGDSNVVVCEKFAVEP
jgi:hypothetical protein